jgi:hypothetical protein
MTTCPKCDGEVVDIEVTLVQHSEGMPMAGCLASVCSECGEFAGELCDACGGRWLWRWDGPGQAIWICEGCGDADIAWHMPVRPHTWTCLRCSRGFYGWIQPAEPAICTSCRPR